MIIEFTSWHPTKLNLSNSNENLAKKQKQLILPWEPSTAIPILLANVIKGGRICLELSTSHFSAPFVCFIFVPMQPWAKSPSCVPFTRSLNSTIKMFLVDSLWSHLSNYSAYHGFKQNNRTARLEPGKPWPGDSTIHGICRFLAWGSVAGETHHNFPLCFWKSRLGILAHSHHCLICCQVRLRSLLIAGVLPLRHRFAKSSKESQELRLVCHRASWNLEGSDRQTNWKS